MKKKPFVLWLIWQNEETRQRYHVGSLFHSEGEYTFAYQLDGERRTLKDAIKNGYTPHLSFPDIEKTYVSKQLFAPFARRLPDKRRPDFRDILTDLGLPLDYTEMDLLRATGGRLATDSYEFVAPIHLIDNHFSLDFYIAGWRYYDGDHVINSLHVGTNVYFEIEPSNDEDDMAVIVLTADKNHKLGYIPAFYSGFMFEVIKNKEIYEAKIDRVNLKAKPQQKVNISIAGRLSEGYALPTSTHIEPLQLLV